MGREQKVIAGDIVPLFVDVDRTLVRADISLESFVRIALSNLFGALRVCLWLLRGRAFAKAMAARHAPIDPARLPYRQEVLDLIADARTRGRPVILASASHWRNVRRIARHLHLVENVLATRARANLKGHAKLAAIQAHVGPAGAFDYVGDSRADACLWRCARRGWSVGLIPARSQVPRLGPASSPAWRIILKAMRPHQWAKNALVLVPALTSGLFFEASVLLSAVAAMILMSLVASAIYILNDLVDIDADRAHRTKKRRPLAHGDLTIPTALGLCLFLTVSGLAGAWLLGGTALAAWFIAYMAITVAYSFRLKAVMVGDALVLASLYTIRIWIGAVATGVAVSYWLLLFSVFLFLSLAYLKRYVEMRDAAEPERLLNGRGYVGGDMDVVMMSGISAGMVAVLVLALFAHEPSTADHYGSPELLLLLCLPLIYWLNRIWMMARRGEVDGDPVAFAIKDRRSLLVAATAGLIFAAALLSPSCCDMVEDI